MFCYILDSIQSVIQVVFIMHSNKPSTFGEIVANLPNKTFISILTKHIYLVRTVHNNISITISYIFGYQVNNNA